MSQAKCPNCGKKRIVFMDGVCRPCFRDHFAKKIRDANAPGASDQVKEECWDLMNRAYAQVRVDDLYPPQDGGLFPPSQRGTPRG